MKIKAIIFDLDGTLLDTIPDITDAANKMLSNHNFPVYNQSNYIQWIGNGALKLIERAIPGKHDMMYLQQLLDEYLEIHKHNCINKTKVYSGIDDLLNYLTLQNFSFSILTNKPDALTQKVVNHYFPDWKFSFVFGQKPEYPKKPDPTRALEIANKLNIKSDEVLFIGDSETDVKTSLAAKMSSVGVTWGYGTKDSMLNAGCKTFADNASELIELIKEI